MPDGCNFVLFTFSQTILTTARPIMRLVPALTLASLALSYSLEGTWTSRSKTVLTGPSFFDPVDELLIEPSLPGISYSFDGKGNWEQAIYQVTSNPVNHSCATAVLLWQHGTYTVHQPDDKTGETKLTLTPIGVDGRQLMSYPCNDRGVSTYMRYNQVETILNFNIELDHYYGELKLTLYEWDGTKKQPMWLQYKPPLMLPTQTLNPTHGKRKRGLNRLVNHHKTNGVLATSLYDDVFKIISLSMVVAGVLGLMWLNRPALLQARLLVDDLKQR